MHDATCLQCLSEPAKHTEGHHSTLLHKQVIVELEVAIPYYTLFSLPFSPFIILLLTGVQIMRMQ